MKLILLYSLAFGFGMAVAFGVACTNRVAFA